MTRLHAAGVAAVIVAAVCGFALLAAAQAPAPTAPPAPATVSVPALPAMEETSAPGLKLTIQSASGGDPDVRASRLVALRVPAESAPSPFVAPGAFKATWQGFLTLRIQGDYHFSALGNGTLKVTLNDATALELTGGDFANKIGPLVKLKKGKNPIKVEYASPPTGDASVRLHWSAKEFVPETVPPSVFSHDGADAALRGQGRLRHGRELVANLRCTKCHTSDAAAGGTAMRELSADAPSLLDAGQRYGQAWLARWISNPHAMRPDTEMPNVFNAPAGAVDPRARDIAAYLVESSTKPQAAAGEEQTSPNLVTEGARLFTGLGCVACHVLPDNEKPTEVATKRVLLEHVNAKFLPGALKAFLLKPEQHYAWIRMPNFKLADGEAAALAAFLRSRPAPAIEAEPAGDARRGLELFQTAGCINCHASKVENHFKAAPLDALLATSDWTRGCVAGEPAARGKAPDFALGDAPRAAIRALAASRFESIKRDTSAEFAERQVAQLNCLACHSRDRQDDSWSQLTAEAESILQPLPPAEVNHDSPFMGDQSRPPLTWTGEKLRPQWAADFIGGTLKYKPRPWLQARMPAFPARAKLLAQGLAQAHGNPPASPAHAKADPALAPLGQKLVGKAGGFSCVQCHAVGEQKALAPFEAPAINFAHVSERLNKEYYERWVYNPQRVQPGTRMPQFADIELRTAIKDPLNGDAKQQFEAIWNYLLAGQKIEPPQ